MRLIILSIPGWQIFCGLITDLPEVHGQCVNFSPLPVWIRLWGLLIYRPSCCGISALSRFSHSSVDPIKLDASFDDPDDVASSLSSGFLHLVSTLSDTSKLQVAPSIKSDKLWCQARVLILPVSLATTLSVPKDIHYVSSHPAAFGFKATTPPHNTVLEYF